MNKSLLLIIIATIFIIAGCVGVLNTTTTDIDGSAKGSDVNVSSSALGFLHLTTPSQLKLDVTKKLDAKCNGIVKNVTTVSTVRTWFGIVQVYKVDATGICVAAKQ